MFGQYSEFQFYSLLIYQCTILTTSTATKPYKDKQQQQKDNSCKLFYLVNGVLPS